MHHQSDDDHFAPPLKVLRKRLNGVYREDHGFSGPTRRYVIMVALLVGLASVPTLAVLSTGSEEISGRDRPGAMDVPFLPPPATGPVVPPSPSQPPPSSPPPSPSASGSVGGLSDKDQTKRGYVGKQRRPAATSKRTSSARDVPAISNPAKPRKSASRKPVPKRAPVRKKEPRRSELPAVSDFPEIPGLPVVPEENDVTRPESPPDFPEIPDLPDVPDDDEPDWRDCEPATVRESSTRKRTVQPVRSRDRSEPSRRSAVAERPYNIRPARILEQSYAERGLNVHRLLNQPRSEEERMLVNRPYRGQHRAEQTNHADERATAAWQRSTRVGRHHAEPADEHYSNRR
ncbi:hypothetical protein ACTI_22180 [Actinoplanes sp. OR16]|uniref:hypothetical protein n=1 Tax=Actinoplanes sp. OR16 TaxID=946334 RepID=UPI000F6F648E|nr:hypothetical protein [Actinoplanes sp. OR16]BBH65533.1 hypothetical protein ACTI_22180 [Actinoplanes sp. OR16]